MDDTSVNAPCLGLRVLPLSDAASVAETLLAQTLRGCAGQLGLQGVDGMVDLLRRGDPVAHHVCEQAIARNVAEYLSHLDNGVKAVYRYDCGGQSSGSDETGPRLAIHLVVLTRQRTAALISVLVALDRALTQTVADYYGSKDVPHVLNVYVIDETDTRNEASYAALLFPPHLEPVPVWQR